LKGESELAMQRTISRKVSVQGIGLHTGEQVEVFFNPAPPNSGIAFKRIDEEGREPIKVSLRECKADVKRGSVLIRDGTKIYTVEHLLSAIRGLGIDNLLIEIKGGEPPALDGSALPFVEKLLEAGIVEQDVLKRRIILLKPVWVNGKDSFIAAFPHPTFKVSYTISYNHSFLKSQFLSYELSPETFPREIAPARTYAFKNEVDFIFKSGLGKGGSLDNTVVIDEGGVLNPEGLRFEDEFVRHKILDLIGDMALLDGWLSAHIVAIRAGHALHLELASRILEEVGEKGDAEDRYHYEGPASSLSLSLGR